MILASALDFHFRLLSSHGDDPPLFSATPRALFAACESGRENFGIAEEAAGLGVEIPLILSVPTQSGFASRDRLVQVCSRRCAGSCRRVPLGNVRGRVC